MACGLEGLRLFGIWLVSGGVSMIQERIVGLSIFAFRKMMGTICHIQLWIGSNCAMEPRLGRVGKVGQDTAERA